MERALLALSERAREEVDSLQDLQKEQQLVNTLTQAEHVFEAGNLQTTAAYLEDLRQMLDD